VPWYFYLLDFLGGLLLANGVPHFVQGISGNPFPTPFAKPPGVGDSSPVTNVLWGLGNLAVGGLLLTFFWHFRHPLSLGSFAVDAGVVLMSVMLAWHFGKVWRGKRIQK
jgi:hypothetical protein